LLFSIKNKNDGVRRVAGVRDYFTEDIGHFNKVKNDDGKDITESLEIQSIVNKAGDTISGAVFTGNSVDLSALNIGDVAYQSHLSRLKYAAVNEVTGRQGVFNVGRNFGLKINVPLSFDK
jgi:hypothetical protein